MRIETGRLDRRDFLTLATGGMAALAGGCAAWRGHSLIPLPKAAKRRSLKVGVIGAQGQGERYWRTICGGGDRLVALCDVDERSLSAARKTLLDRYRVENLHVFKDFRVMFDAHPDLDALFIATPDHGHAAQALWAIERKIPVYVAPPVVRTLGELKHLLKCSDRNGVPLWQGSSISATPLFRQCVELLRGGIIGDIAEIYAWTAQPLWPQGYPSPSGSDPVPQGLDWDLWLGPSPYRPFKRSVYHRFNWRGWEAFGTGTLGSCGGDLLQLPFQARNLHAPTRIENLTPPRRGSKVSYPVSSHLRFHLSGGGLIGRGPTLHWYDGGEQPDIPQMELVRRSFRGRLPSEGVLIWGERGFWLMVQATGKRHYLYLNSDAKFRAIQEHPACNLLPQTLPSLSLEQTFLEAVRSGAITGMRCNINLAMMETLLTGCVAQLEAGPVYWRPLWSHFSRGVLNRTYLNQPVRPGWIPPL